MIVFDTTAASLLFVPSSAANHEGKPIKYARERLDALIEKIAKENGKIVLPTPVLSELLVKIPEKANELVRQIRTSPWFQLESFDPTAAVELGLRTAKAIAEGDKREGSRADWTKVKFDRQIVAIAISSGASQILSNDPDIAAIGKRWGIDVIGLQDLPIPPELIPPPLIAAMQEESHEERETKPSPTQLQGGDDGPPQDQAGAKAKASEEAAKGQEGPPVASAMLGSACPYCGQAWKNASFPMGWDPHAEFVCPEVQHLPQADRKPAFRQLLEADGHIK
jgi:hypothetical protein